MSRSSRRGPWLPDEDTTLLHLVRTQGPNNWVRISQHMRHRSPKQCRERYHQNLKPSLNHEPISPQEGELIEQLVHEMGKRWAEIARRLGNRSDNAVKNWWNGSMNRRRRTTTQHSTSGSKSVGPRTQPVPASIPTPAPSLQRHHSYMHEHPATERFFSRPAFHGHPVSIPPSFEHSPRYGTPLPLPRSYSARPEQHDRQPTLARCDPISTSPHDYAIRSSGSSPRHPQLPTLPSFSPDRAGLQLPPITSLERRVPSPIATSPPAPSPAETEASHASSHLRAPSLVSDNQSNYSISPKTVTSPRPGLPVSKAPSMDVWPELQRRYSAGDCLDEGMEACRMRRPEDDLRSYQSSNWQKTSSQKMHIPGKLSLSGLERVATSTNVPGSVAVPPKDQRLAVSSLLD
jgi:Myb-like DNA-binding protein FlbD